MAYSRKSAVSPIAASNLLLPKCFSMLITTLYVEARVSNPVIPIKVGTWPTAILIADPVMNAEIETNGMRSTIQPALIRPMNIIMQPAITAKHDAIT